jgi:hypothetical protein
LIFGKGLPHLTHCVKIYKLTWTELQEVQKDENFPGRAQEPIL